MIYRKKSYFIVLLVLSILSINTDSFAQSKKKSRRQLELEKKRNLSKLAETKKALENTREKKEVTVGKIKAIKEQITTQEEQISLMEQDMELIEMEMLDIIDAQKMLARKLDSLKKSMPPCFTMLPR